MAARLPLKPGSSDAKGDDVTHWWDWAFRYAKSYNFLLGKRDGYYGNDEAAFTREMQRRLGLVQDGIFGPITAGRVGYAGAKPTPPRRPIWLYSAPGSGAPYWVGPSNDLGEMVAGHNFNGPGRDSLSINHQPVGFPIGGYLGVMGGDPALSYLDVIHACDVELERLLWDNPDVQKAIQIRRADPRAPVSVELWLSGYSQSADALLESAKRLFGDAGPFALIRDRLNGLILFGNPATAVTGIARKTFPDWLNALTHNINVSNDFYAVAGDRLRPLFYEWFIRAETEIPFVVYCAQIILPALTSLLPGVGPLMAAPLSLLLSVIPGGQAGASQPPNPELIQALSPTGLLMSIPDLIAIIAALPGLQAHGAYHLPLPDFGGRTGPQVGYDIIAGFRR
jgi:hypothetical protein